MGNQQVIVGVGASRRTATGVILATVAVLIAVGCGLLSPSAEVVAAGDIAKCGTEGDEATADLVEGIDGTVLALGDEAYPRGTAANFEECYGPTWGRFKGRTKPVPGNHEYYTEGARGYFEYFGEAAGDPEGGYYSYELGAWHVVVLNSNCGPAGGCEEGSPQQRWLANDLTRSGARCSLAYMHHPRFSSGLHGSDRSIAPLWRTLARGGADVALAGHDHHYERFAPIGGIRSFVVGTGGRNHYPVFRRLSRPKSVVMNDRTFGVLELTLRDGRYDWRFAPIAGSSFGDAGSARCR